MSKTLRIILLAALILIPIVFYKSFNKKERKEDGYELILPAAVKQEKQDLSRPQIALIFDDLGESLKELKDIYDLDIPVTLSIIPGLKFSKNIAHIGARCNFSIFIHLPLQPKQEKSTYSKTDKYKFISSSQSKRENKNILKYYLNYMRIAIGLNNHMGSAATEDSELMNFVLDDIKRKGLVFVDSRTSLESVAYDLASQKKIVCGYNEGFLDSVDSVEAIEKKIEELVIKAQEKSKIIVIAHPRKNTIEVLREKLTFLKKKVRFVTIKDYFKL